MLIVLSTSGNSPNILRAIEQAKSRGLVTAALLGSDGGKAPRPVRHRADRPRATCRTASRRGTRCCITRCASGWKTKWDATREREGRLVYCSSNSPGLYSADGAARSVEGLRGASGRTATFRRQAWTSARMRKGCPPGKSSAGHINEIKGDEIKGTRPFISVLRGMIWLRRSARAGGTCADGRRGRRDPAVDRPRQSIGRRGVGEGTAARYDLASTLRPRGRQAGWRKRKNKGSCPLYFPVIPTAQTRNYCCEASRTTSCSWPIETEDRDRAGRVPFIPPFHCTLGECVEGSGRAA